MPIETLLIANRGEIACRIIRTARARGLRTIAVYSEADADAPHVRLADDAAPIGPAPAAESYLDADRILAAAAVTGADAIHPGYGFLSENADFAAATVAAGLVFIGPDAAAIRAMGDKAGARRAMAAVGVPVAPGYDDEDQSDGRLHDEAARIGFPLMVKAAAGGGGKGMRVAPDAASLADALALARAEAEAAFGDGRLILERAIQRPRHVEIQIFADAHGATIHLGERDCSVQRRHQKVLEEAPCPALDPALRAAMGAAAVRAAEAVTYLGAGTVEFLLDEDGAFYFLEMNTRLQVEHGVTEAVTGLDLVALQIHVAEGGALPMTQADLRIDGCAIEARLYAEDPAAGFLPSTGEIALWRPSHAVRVDAGIEEGGVVSPHYDPMLAKLIAHGPTRDAARRRLIRALEETAIAGPAVNRAFLIAALSHPDFARGAATTAFIDEVWPEGPAALEPPQEALALAAAAALSADCAGAHDASGLVSADLLGWRSDGAAPVPVTLTRDGRTYAFSATPRAGGWRILPPGEAGEDGTPEDVVMEVDLAGPDHALVNGRRRRAAWRAEAEGDVAVSLGAFDGVFSRPSPGAAGDAAAGSGAVTAPMPGLIVEVLVRAGDRVEAGAPVAVIEAMKMRHRILAEVTGAVMAVHVETGAQMRRGESVALIEAEPAAP